MNTKQTPIERLRHHVTGAIERGEKQAIVAVTDSGKAPSVRKFQLTLTDNDGETHEYSVQARNPWEVLNFTYGKMSASGDFYGHTLDMSQDISVSELIADANGSFIIL